MTNLFLSSPVTRSNNSNASLSGTLERLGKGTGIVEVIQNAINAGTLSIAALDTNIFNTNGTFSTNREGELNGNTLDFKQGATTVLGLNPTTGITLGQYGQGDPSVDMTTVADDTDFVIAMLEEGTGQLYETGQASALANAAEPGLEVKRRVVSDPSVWVDNFDILSLSLNVSPDLPPYSGPTFSFRTMASGEYDFGGAGQQYFTTDFRITAAGFASDHYGSGVATDRDGFFDWFVNCLPNRPNEAVGERVTTNSTLWRVLTQPYDSSSSHSSGRIVSGAFLINAKQTNDGNHFSNHYQFTSKPLTSTIWHDQETIMELHWDYLQLNKYGQGAIDKDSTGGTYASVLSLPFLSEEGMLTESNPARTNDLLNSGVAVEFLNGDTYSKDGHAETSLSIGYNREKFLADAAAFGTGIDTYRLGNRADATVFSALSSWDGGALGARGMTAFNHDHFGLSLWSQGFNASRSIVFSAFDGYVEDIATSGLVPKTTTGASLGHIHFGTAVGSNLNVGISNSFRSSITGVNNSLTDGRVSLATASFEMAFHPDGATAHSTLELGYTFELDVFRMHKYGSITATANSLGKVPSNMLGVATDGTVIEHLVPAYPTTAAAAAHPALLSGEIFKVSNADGTSSLHMKD